MTSNKRLARVALGAKLDKFILKDEDTFRAIDNRLATTVADKFGAVYYLESGYDNGAVTTAIKRMGLH